MLENSISGGFAKKLFLHFFTIDELSEPNVNIYGRALRGDPTPKKPLNTVYVNKIEKDFKSRTEGSQKVKEDAWKDRVGVVNQHMCHLRRSKKK